MTVTYSSVIGVDLLLSLECKVSMCCGSASWLDLELCWCKRRRDLPIRPGGNPRSAPLFSSSLGGIVTSTRGMLSALTLRDELLPALGFIAPGRTGVDTHRAITANGLRDPGERLVLLGPSFAVPVSLFFIFFLNEALLC